MAGSGYTRQSVASIVPTAVVRAAPINAEFDKLRDAFTQSDTGTTGHRHDGSSDEGSYVPFIADLDKQNYLTVDQTNNRFGLFIEVSGSPVEQLRFQDGVIVPVTDNDIDLGTSSLEYKNAYFDGTVYADTVSIGDNDYTTITDNTYAVSSGDLTFDVSGDIIFDADNADVFLKDAGTQYAAFVNNTGNLILKSGSTTAITFTGANADFAGTLDVTGAGTFDSTLSVAGVATLSSNATVGGTLGVTGAATLSSTLGVTGAATFSDNLTVTGDATVGGNLTVNGTLTTLNTTNTVVSDTLMELGNGTTGTPVNDSGIVIERGSADNAFIGFDESADKFIVGTGSFTGASTGDLTITKGTLQANLDYDTLSDGTITVTGFVDEDDMASDSATLIPTQQSVKAYVTTIAGQSNNIVGLTATAAELNQLDASAASPSSVTLEGTDGFLLIDTSAGTLKQALISDFNNFITTDLVGDTTPQLGGNLDLNSSDITGTGNINTTGSATFSSSLTALDASFTGTGAVDVPAGTTAQRPGTPSNGMIRYNSDDAQFEGYADGAWGAIGGGGDTQTASTSSTTQTAIATYTASTSLGIEITVIATDTVATERTITKLLVTHDGTTAVATQYGEVNTATAMATYDVDISGGNVRLLATAASANSTNFTASATILA
jgi:fibronectin-binding autotransporter adhesin